MVVVKSKKAKTPKKLKESEKKSRESGAMSSNPDVIISEMVDDTEEESGSGVDANQLDMGDIYKLLSSTHKRTGRMSAQISECKKEATEAKEMAGDAKRTAALALQEVRKAVSSGLQSTSASNLGSAQSNSAAASSAQQKTPAKFQPNFILVQGFCEFKDQRVTDESCITGAAMVLERLKNQCRRKNSSRWGGCGFR